MTKAIALLLFSITAVFFGCTTVGKEISEDQITLLEKGKTSSEDTIILFGKPTTISTMSNGRKVMVYSFAHVQSRPETFIPFVGAFVGGADIRSSALVLTFDEKGILQDFTSHKSMNGSGVGFAGGTYQSPDRTLPTESIQK